MNPQKVYVTKKAKGKGTFSMALILTRRVGEKIIIGDATVTVIGVGPHLVRVAIDAPKSIVVVREEIRLKKRPDRDTFPAPA